MGADVRGSLWRWLIDRGGALALIVLVTYIAATPTNVVDGDNAEFCALGAVGGRAHPSGYPAYVMYLRATAWLPGATPAHTAALATCLLGALAVFVLHAACRAWGARPLAATLTCALYAASPIVLRMHTEAEVFAGNALVVAMVLWLSGANTPIRGTKRAALPGLVAGLGVANHLTCTVVTPIGIVGVARSIRESANPRRAAAASLACVVTGLSAYGYLLVADSPVSYGDVETFGDVLRFFLREDYGGPVGFTVSKDEPDLAANLGALVGSLGRAWLWLPGLLGLATLGLRIARPRVEPRHGWALLAACLIVAGPLLALRFNVPPEGIGLYVCQRFHLLPILLLAIPVASALDEIGCRIGERARALARPAVSTSIAISVFLALAAASRPWLRAMHSPALERYVEAAFLSAPPNAIIVVRSEEVFFTAEYSQHARGLRPDLQVVNGVLLSRSWYRERVERMGIPLEPGYSAAMTPRQAEMLLGTGRPLLVDIPQFEVSKNLPGHPQGALFRVLPPGVRPPKLADVFALNQQLFDRFDLDYPHPGPNDQFAALAHQRYAAIWRVLSHAASAAGDETAAAQAATVAAALDPR